MNDTRVNWPPTIMIKDVLRCSVTFDTIDDLYKGCNKFVEIMNVRSFGKYSRPVKKSSNKDGKNGKNDEAGNENIICSINRIKNGFNEIPSNAKNCNLNEFDYKDIKFNVNVYYKTIIKQIDKEDSKHEKEKRNQFYDVFIVAEIQFLIGWYLNAKKMMHSMYSFARKGDLFSKIYKNNKYTNDNDLNYYLKTILISKNLSQLSIFLQTMNPFEKKFVKMNINHLIKFSNECKFGKGKKLLQLIGNKS